MRFNSGTFPKYYIAVLLIMFMISGGVLSAASAWDEGLFWVMDKFGVPENEQTLLVETIREFESQGVPPSVLIPRVEEGIAKHIPAGRIQSVIEREGSAYIEARSIITQVVSEQEAQTLTRNLSLWTRTATLLLQGVENRRAAELLSLFSGPGQTENRWERYRYGTLLYTALIDWGLSDSESFRIISAVAASDIPAGDYKGVMDILLSSSRYRVSVPEMIERIEQVSSQVSSIEQMSIRVLY